MSAPLVWLGSLLLLAGCAGTARHAQSSPQDQALLRRLVVESGNALNRRDLEGMVASISPDLVLSYPGIADMGYESLKRAYAEMIAPGGASVTTVPTIEEVLVSGDLAVVRVTWTTTIASGPSDQKTRRTRDMQIWRRDDRREWKFIRGMHYREPAAPSN
jgi:ketosteroid isomerase-like protein